MECLDDNAVTAFVARTLPEPERARVIEHLDGCETCMAITCAAAWSIDTTVDNTADTTAAPGVATAPGLAAGAVAMAATQPGDAGAAPGARAGERRVAGRYTLVSMIGEGAMGVVYVADDPQLDRRVALKIVRSGRLSETFARARLSREARAMAQVKHANVVTVYDAGELDDGVFIAMELVEGETLAGWLARGHGWRDVLRVFDAAGRGLSAAHAAGIVHRDFKPENVLVDRDGRACVTDFGLAFAPASGPTSSAAVAEIPLGDAGALTRTGALVGTPLYMSPEQHRGDRADARSDQYSFAVALYLALYRVPPFGGTTVGELRAAVLAGKLPPAPGGTAVPARVHRVLSRALAVHPDARFPSMDRLLAELAAAARPVWRRRGGRVAIAAGLVGCAAAGLAVLAMSRSPGDRGASRPSVVAPVAAPVAASPAKARRVALLFERFDNRTGEPLLDDTIDAALVAALYRSTTIDPFSGAELAQLTFELGLHAPALDPIGQALTRRDGRRALAITGTIERTGAGFSLAITARDTAVGAAPPFTLREAAATLDDVLPAALRLAGALRSHAGEPPPRGGEFLLSRSLAAVHELTAGKRLGIAGDLAAAHDLLQRAVTADPDLSEAHAQLAGVLYNLSRLPEAAIEYERALADRDRMPERLRLALLGDYYDASGRYVESVAAYEQLLAKWPGDVRTEVAVVASAIDGGSWPLALELARRAVADHGNLAVVRANLVLAEVAIGQFADAVHDGTAMLAELPRPTQFGFTSLAIAQALTGDPPAAHRTLDQLAAADPGFADDARVDLLLYEGRLADAEAILRRQAEPAIQRGAAGDARGSLVVLARVLLRRGDKVGARKVAGLVTGDPSVRNAYVVASLLVDVGDAHVARELARAWAGNAIAEWRIFGKLLDGDVLRARGDLRGAIAAYTEASRLGDLWIVHARLGLAQLAAGAFGDAARELAQCVARRGEGAVFLNPSLSYLPEIYLALARAKDGAHASDALAAYRAVVALAPTAQGDPVTEAARQRVAALAHAPLSAP
jgi:tRNA A-37 threonylcarbamoyl transferase component Bud32/tetratricopeptide (TPR) repeat protein